ncbi:extensin family protein [Azospirillum sp. SYSU D00513]|uniref:extensin-like domain-containing protein n=1 Tax=Azospirillum sp. SYSU D00513 TaxID=2812561 RepID=UPI001A95E415|nr:extensin family protein [Azospirillum sp. SYSU D00513]
MRWFMVLVLAALLAAGALLLTGRLALPPDFDPWAPLDIRAEPNLLTGFKLSRLEGDLPRCLAALGRSGLRFTPLPDRPSDRGCPLEGTVRVSRSEGLEFSSAFTATCAVSAAWSLFERHALQPAARAHFRKPVTRVVHLGSYACRNIYNRASARRSEHATANALDVAAFILEDGTRISVAVDWNGGSPAKRAFLRDVQQGACRFFDVVLGPDYNQAHRDHFHLDMGPFGSCR